MTRNIKSLRYSPCLCFMSLCLSFFILPTLFLYSSNSFYSFSIHKFVSLYTLSLSVSAYKLYQSLSFSFFHSLSPLSHSHSLSISLYLSPALTLSACLAGRLLWWWWWWWWWRAKKRRRNLPFFSSSISSILELDRLRASREPLSDQMIIRSQWMKTISAW